jgi:ATP-dependent DNA ligase
MRRPFKPSADNGLEAWNEVVRGNYEGMVAKDPASTYTPGRTLSWLKVGQKAGGQRF